ncbi:WYL domain-containing protein [Ruminococcus albus]|uniref:WYL domain-containing protein n=1 Tax=Ruminococcus albus TaxID=1264 RepID=A0A1H7N713_RUMAL|nr:WYL domain-containing protein [Ruminococcus albus]SEL19303.1 WYL domain-containing protein [Ruminococcus albus]
MAGFSELIKNFEKARDYLRDFYICGYKVRGDFNKKSSRTYDDEKRRAESWLGEYLRYDDLSRGRQVSISLDSSRISENPLYQAFYTRSFTDNDIRLHFLLLDILIDGESYTINELCTMIEEMSGYLPEEQTLRLKLKEYTEEGIVISEKHGKKLYYRLCSDTAADWLDSDGIRDAVRFFSQTQEFGLIGNTILKSAELKNELFYMKHYYIVHTLEDEVILSIVEAMDNHQLLEIEIFSRNGNGGVKTVLPMQILSSLQTGRRFLAVYIPSEDRFTSFRLDLMPMPKTAGRFDKYDDIRARYEKLVTRCFGVSMDNAKAAEPLRITFAVDESTEYFIIDRLEREKRCGVLKKTGDGEFTLTLNLCDPNEAMKWVKTFIGRIIKIEGGTEFLRKRFADDIDRMYAIYGGEDDQDLQ